MAQQPFENFAAVGRDILVYLSLTNSSTPPDDEEFTELGALRGLEYGPEWDTADTTARGTGSGFSRTALVTYKNNDISMDGLKIINDDFLYSVEQHVEFPPDDMRNQPYAWVRIIEPREDGKTITKDYPSLLTSFRQSAPYDTEYTYTMATSGQGDPIVTAIPAPPPGG